mmetsp:Transcript_42066/g.136534  ORF Transcript_42066/g.136534 Transcript_42066/m.136534 type:complete len:248 (-) Transcript_42066:479-1222(-)
MHVIGHHLVSVVDELDVGKVVLGPVFLERDVHAREAVHSRVELTHKPRRDIVALLEGFGGGGGPVISGAVPIARGAGPGRPAGGGGRGGHGDAARVLLPLPRLARLARLARLSVAGQAPLMPDLGQQVLLHELCRVNYHLNEDHLGTEALVRLDGLGRPAPPLLGGARPLLVEATHPVRREDDGHLARVDVLAPPVRLVHQEVLLGVLDLLARRRHRPLGGARLRGLAVPRHRHRHVPARPPRRLAR